MTDYRKLFDLTGRKALVLGAGSGIGKASAEALAALGAETHCADLDLAHAEVTAAAIRGAGGKAAASRADASSGAEIAALVARAKAALGRIDIAVTTPGINIRKLVLNYSEDEFDRIVDLNLKGTFFFFREVGRLMVLQKGGSIIASSSVRATTIEPGLAVYGATKAAISLLVKGFAAEVGAAGVRVNAIAPGIIETPLFVLARNGAALDAESKLDAEIARCLAGFERGGTSQARHSYFERLVWYEKMRQEIHGIPAPHRRSRR